MSQKKGRNLKRKREREMSGETHTCEDIQIWQWHLLEAYCKEDKSCIPQSLLSSLSRPDSPSLFLSFGLPFSVSISLTPYTYPCHCMSTTSKKQRKFYVYIFIKTCIKTHDRNTKKKKDYKQRCRQETGTKAKRYGCISEMGNVLDLKANER